MHLRSLSIFVSLLTMCRLIISQNPIAMCRTPKTRSSSVTSSTHLTISLVDQCFCTLVEKRAEKADSRTCRLEVSAQSRLKFPRNKLIYVVIQILMEKFNGLGVILENRYYGESYPYNTSTTDELRFLTTEQSKKCTYYRLLNLLT